MALSLLSNNTCNFSGCGLHFSHMYDLVAHIELIHIPAIEEDHRQKTAAAAAAGDETRVNVAPNLPLSYFQRVFPIPYRPVSCRPEIVKVSFNHYRKRTNSGNLISNNMGHMMSQVSTPRIDDLNTADQSTGQQGDDVVDCAPKFNVRSSHTHAMASGEDLRGAEVTAEGNISIPVPGSQPPTTPSPTKYAASRPHKCQQCSKRYKTIQGLQNHASQAHQKSNGSSSQGDPPSPSPAVVAQLITQARAHGQQAAHAQAQAAIERANLAAQHNSRAAASQLPVSVAMQSTAQHYQQSVVPQSHLPVRSIHVQQNRIIAQPSSGVMQSPGGHAVQHQQVHQRRQLQYPQQQNSLSAHLQTGGDGRNVFTRSPHHSEGVLDARRFTPTSSSTNVGHHQVSDGQHNVQPLE